MAQGENDKVDKLDESLYSRKGFTKSTDVRSSISQEETPEVLSDWQSPELKELLTHEREKVEHSGFMKKFFVFALLFFISSILIAGFVFFGGSNFISSKNVDIQIVGPANAPAGNILELEVTIENNNNADLEFANFSIQYPSGSRSAEDSAKSLTFFKEELGVIGAGDEVVRNVKMVLIGETGEVKEIKFSVEYKVDGSNATFYKDKSYEVVIGSSPVALLINMPESVASGEDFKVVVNVSHNSEEVLKDVMLRAEYPYGYGLTSSSPATLAGDNVWALGDLAPGSSKKIEIEGRLLGEDSDQRTFRFYVGVAEGASLNPNFKTNIISAQETILVERPAVSLSATFNGEVVPQYVAPAGGTINTTIRYQNNMREKLVNPKLEITFSGAAFNESSVQVYNSGFYNSVNNKATWDIRNGLGVAELLPGDNGSVSFAFSSFPEETILGSRDIRIEIRLTGSPPGLAPLAVTENRTIKVASQVNFSAYALHSIGPFENTGDLPLKAEKETTYSVVMLVGNTREDLNDAKVTAKLAPAVKWLGAKEGENISYHEASNTITWDIGGLSSGLGFTEPSREGAFQISITPSKTQIGMAPVLVNAISFSAYDTLSEKTMTITAPQITTTLTRDPAFIQGDDIVSK